MFITNYRLFSFFNLLDTKIQFKSPPPIAVRVVIRVYAYIRVYTNATDTLQLINIVRRIHTELMGTKGGVGEVR